ncbi:MAG: DUF4258 domain-containing protein [Candidatus Heimdallarchaeota archaeon]|nr:DUF4258 domain-containing protein [Candidatus Heimdallarchaeota archaeon]
MNKQKRDIFGKPIKYSRHAEEMMERRGIDKKDIEAIRDHGRQEKVQGIRVECHLGKKGKALIAIFDEYPESLVLITPIREGDRRQERQKTKRKGKRSTDF